jgi:hypothetical protein
LHRRRSLLRRFSNMSILRLARWFIPHLQPFYRTIIGIRIAGSLAMYLFSLNSFYRVPQTLSRNARECHKCRSKNPALQVSRLNAEMLSRFRHKRCFRFHNWISVPSVLPGLRLEP